MVQAADHPNETSLECWRALCGALGLADCDREHAKILRSWKSWGRHYHTLDHLKACLAEWNGARSLAARPAEVAMALWFHDAVYRTWRADNESRSAAWVARFLAEHGAGTDVVSNVRQLVLVTAHAVTELSGDAALVVDIDLSILGQPPVVYDTFKRKVRKEYWWVSKRRFAAARGGILKSFLQRPAIYTSPSFCDRYEAQARSNLARAIAALENV